MSGPMNVGIGAPWFVRPEHATRPPARCASCGSVAVRPDYCACGAVTCGCDHVGSVDGEEAWRDGCRVHGAPQSSAGAMLWHEAERSRYAASRGAHVAAAIIRRALSAADGDA